MTVGPAIRIDTPFRPHRLLRGGHLQTIGGAYLPGPHYPYRARAQEIPVSDGDRIVLHIDEHDRASARTVVLVHGLTGSHLSPYMIRTATRLHRSGFRAVRIDMRGWGASAHTSEMFAHAGRSDDLAAAIDYLSSEYHSPITIIGFSLGANQTLKMLGETGSSWGRLDSGISVAAPLDLMECTRSIQTGWNRVYDRSFVKALWKQVVKRKHRNPRLKPYVQGVVPQTLFEFDERVTAPLSGFAGAEEYYRCSSSKAYLGDIRIPTWLITAADDPLVPVTMYQAAELPDAVTSTIVSNGGHLGFVGERNQDPDRRWLDWRIVDWINELD